MNKVVVVLFCLLLTACESDVEYVLRKQKECKQMGGVPVTAEVEHLTPKGIMYTHWQVKCKFKEN